MSLIDESNSLELSDFCNNRRIHKNVKINMKIMPREVSLKQLSDDTVNRYMSGVFHRFCNRNILGELQRYALKFIVSFDKLRKIVNEKFRPNIWKRKKNVLYGKRQI